MRDAQFAGSRPQETVLCESDLGFELLDMLAQANIDFRRLPAEELKSLMATAHAAHPWLKTSTA